MHKRCALELPHTPRETLAAWHHRPRAFERLVPPWSPVRVVEQPAELTDGSRMVFDVGIGPVTVRWEADHTVSADGDFVDEARRGPFQSWRHAHRFVAAGGGSRLEDEVTYTLPYPPLGGWVAGRWVERQLDRMFAFRHRRTVDDLDRHRAFADRPRLKIGITGSSGLVGQSLAAFLTTGGHEVVRFVRRAAGPGEVRWDPSGGNLDPADLEPLDAVVHLAGAPIASSRWTDARKRQIMESRVQGTRLIAEAIAACSTPPSVFISASAVGFYGHRDALVDEADGPGEGFLAEVCQAWEAAAAPARAAGVRVVHPRISVVFSGRGGALAAMRTPFLLGVGGPLGSGRQGAPWIALDDLVGILHEALFQDAWEGPINAVSPEPVTQALQARAIGRALSRPAFVPAPARIIRAVFGELGQRLMLDGAMIRPTRLLELGFRWRRPELDDALEWELGTFVP